MFKRFWWMFLAMLPVGAVVGLLFAAIVTYVMPKIYESEAVIEVMPRIIPSSESQPTATDPQFFGTEVEVIKSRNSLEKVVTDLDLVNRWNMDKVAAIQVLKGIVTTKNIQGTDLISIRVRHTNKVDARDISMEVVKAYRNYRAEIETGDAERRIHELNKAVRDLEDKVEERKKLFSQVAKSNGFRDLPSPENGGDPGKDSVGNRELEVAIYAAKNTQGYVDYMDVKRELETAEGQLYSIMVRKTNESVTLKIGGNGVLIHEGPVIAEKPISPNVTLNLALGSTLGFLLSPLMALGLMCFLNRRKPAKT